MENYNMKENNKYIDTVYDENLKPFTEYPKKLVSYLVERFKINKKNDKLLDVGCGRGEFLNAFINHDIDGYGIDASSYSKKKFPKIKLKIQNLDIEKKLPYDDSFFDFVFSKSVIEHFYEPEFLFEEITRVLKPGGLIITMTPDWNDNYKTFYDDYSHKKPFTLESLEDIQKINNLEIVSIEKFKQLPSTWNKNILINIVMSLLAEITKIFLPELLKKKFKWIRYSKETMLLSVSKKKY
mgnify:CR=1 FL=1